MEEAYKDRIMIRMVGGCFFCTGSPGQSRTKGRKTVVVVICCIVIPRRLSVCLCVCVSVCLSVITKFDMHQKYLNDKLLQGCDSSEPQEQQSKSRGSSPIIKDERKAGREKGNFFYRKSKISLKWCDREHKLQQSLDINLYIPYRLVIYSMTSHDLYVS